MNIQLGYYSGHVSDPMGEVDDQDVEYKPMVVVRTLQPWHTKISRYDKKVIISCV